MKYDTFNRSVNYREMSAENIANWRNIHGINSRILNVYGQTTDRIGRPIVDTHFSKSEYIRMMNFNREFYTKIHKELQTKFPDTKITVRLGGIYHDVIEITIYGQQFGNGTEIRRDGTPSKTDYTYYLKVNDLDYGKPEGYFLEIHNGEYLRIYEIVKAVLLKILNESAEKIGKKSLEMLYRPPNNNEGGPMYQRARNNFMRHLKTRRSGNKRKTRRLKK